MRTGNKIRDIAAWLSWFNAETQSLGALNMYDRAIDAERILCGVLSMILDCQFTNLNNDKSNYPAIDLGNKEKGIAVQITMDTKAEKIQRTLDAFFQHNLDQEFPNRLIVVVLAGRANYKKDFSLAHAYPFNRSEDIWDISRLVQKINALDDEAIDRIYSYLKREMKYPDENPKDTEPVPVDSGSGEVNDSNNKPEKERIQEKKPKAQGGEQKASPLVEIVSLILAAIIVIWCCAQFNSWLFSVPLSEIINPFTPNSIITFLSEWVDRQYPYLESAMQDEVAAVMDGSELTRTTAPIVHYDEQLNDNDALTSFKEDSVSFPFVKQCTRHEVNPISAFYAMIENGLYEKKDVKFDSLLFETENSKYLKKYQSKIYWFRGESDKTDNYGADTLLNDILTLSGKAEDAMDLEAWILDEISKSDTPIIYDSWSDHCYYNYYVCYGQNTAHILCVYMRTGDEKNRLTDIEFQILNLRYCGGKPVGGADSLQRIENCNTAQVASLIIAIENLLVGESGYDLYATTNHTDEGKT